MPAPIQPRISVLAALSLSRQSLRAVGDRAGAGTELAGGVCSPSVVLLMPPRLQGFTCPPTCLSAPLPPGSGSRGCVSSSKPSTSSCSPCLSATAPRAAPGAAPRTSTAAAGTRIGVPSTPVSIPSTQGCRAALPRGWQGLAPCSGQAAGLSQTPELTTEGTSSCRVGVLVHPQRTRCEDFGNAWTEPAPKQGYLGLGHVFQQLELRGDP